MRVLLTSDTVGGVWTFTRELALGLAVRGHRVALTSCGGPAGAADQAALARAGIAHFACRAPLEWMPHACAAMPAARRWFERAVSEFAPDLIHANQFAFVRADVPTVLTVHSDVVSWWRAVHGALPPPSDWHAWYRRLATEALAKAGAAAVPTRSAAADLRTSFGFGGPIAVVPNGVEPCAAASRHGQQIVALAVGRFWDAAKQLSLLRRPDLPLTVRVVGPLTPPAGAGCAATDLGPVNRLVSVGPLDRAGVQSEYARAAICLGLSRYEPFGLAVLEAAGSGCALLLNDLASYREVWSDAAAYFRTNDGDDLVRQLSALAADPQRRAQLAARAHERARRLYSREALVSGYLAVYASLASRAAVV